MLTEVEIEVAGVDSRQEVGEALATAAAAVEEVAVASAIVAAVVLPGADAVLPEADAVALVERVVV
jgi:hypothetical protein